MKNLKLKIVEAPIDDVVTAALQLDSDGDLKLLLNGMFAAYLIIGGQPANDITETMLENRSELFQS